MSVVINCALQAAKHILNRSASDWMDNSGLTWLHHAPKIKLCLNGTNGDLILIRALSRSDYSMSYLLN